MARLGLAEGESFAMTFIPENELENALMRAAKEPAARPEFYRLLLSSDLFIIGKVEGRSLSDTPHTIEPGEQIQIVRGEINSKSFHPVFSSLKRLEENNRDGSDWLSLNGRLLFEMTKGATFVLNPGSAYGKELLAEEIAWMLSPATARQVEIEKPTQVLIGQPSVYPQVLVDVLKVHFATRPEVSAAYLVQIGYPDQKPHPLIGVETTGDWKTLSDSIGRIIAAAAPGQIVDATPIDRTDKDGLSSALIQTRPFYTRPAN
jgi:hypothetical protein